jgi:hypothetical protein
LTFTFEMYEGDGAKVGDYKTSVPGPWNPGDLLYDSVADQVGHHRRGLHRRGFCRAAGSSNRSAEGQWFNRLARREILRCQ